MLSKDCGVIGTVTIGGDDTGVLVRLATTGAMVKVTGGTVTRDYAQSEPRERKAWRI